MPSREDVIEILKTVVDPELFIDIWTLGLIYKVELPDTDKIYIQMTFTTVACPLAPMIIEEVKQKVGTLDGVKEVEVEVVFEPLWEPSEELKAMLGLL